MARNFLQGNYTPKHPEKYRGNVDNIQFRSSWELEVNKFLDNNPNIIEWASEEVAVPYLSSLDGKIHKYYPDYLVKYKDKNGNIVTEMWEVKPKNQIQPPKRKGKRKKTQIYEQTTYVKNTDKWKHAQHWCKQHGITFRLLSEDQIFK
jgi:hypothetical protein